MLHTPDAHATSTLVQQNRGKINILNFSISKWIPHSVRRKTFIQNARIYWTLERGFSVFINEQITHGQEISKSVNFGTTVHAAHLSRPTLAEFELGCQYGICPTNDCASISMSTQWRCLPCNVVQTSSQVSTVTLQNWLFLLCAAAGNLFLLNTQRNWISHLSDFTLMFSLLQLTTDRSSLYIRPLISQQLYSGQLVLHVKFK